MSEDKSNVKASRMQKGRKSINYLQKLKDEGTPIVQMCPGPRDQYFTMAAEMADCDICRLTVPGDGQGPPEADRDGSLVAGCRPAGCEADPHQLLYADPHLRIQGGRPGQRCAVYELRRGFPSPHGHQQ